MKILLVEDDYLTAEGLISDLKGDFSNLDVEHISTESEFCDKLEMILQNPPKAVVLDIMIRWTNPQKEMPLPPPEVVQNGPWRAGLRCLAKLLERNPRLPVILYSVLDAEDLKGEIPPNVVQLAKSPDPAGIIAELRTLGLR